MDWGAALGGLDDTLAHIVARNKAHADSQLDLLKTGQSIRIADRGADRLEAAQKAQEDYYKGLISTRQQTTDQVLRDKADADELLNQYNAATDPMEKKALAAALTRYKIRLPEMSNQGGPVFTLKSDGTTQKLDVPDGAKVIKLGADASGAAMDIPEQTLMDAVDAMKQGNGTLWNALVARGGQGNKTREMLAKAYAAHRPDDFEGVVAAKAGAASDARVLTDLTKAVVVQTALHETALKNFDVLKKTMEHIPDLNSPALNIAPRYLAKNLIAPVDMAAFNMARESALREYERLVASNLEAKGQITDSSRAAYKALLDEDTPLASVVAMIDVMNNDMTNLQSSLAKEKGLIETSLKERGKMEKPAAVTETTTPTATGGNVANPPHTVGAPLDKEFAVFGRPADPALGKGKPVSTGKVMELAAKFGTTPELAAKYLIANGYTVGLQ